jgi:methanethiol S-methyltransferase
MGLLVVVGDYWPSLLAFLGFGALHSVCAHEAFKAWLARWTTSFFVEHFWRLTYCSLSYVALYDGIAVLHWGWHPRANAWLIDYPDWLWQALLLGHLGSLGLTYAAFLQSDYLEFWGLRQAWRGLRILAGGSAPPPPLELFGTHRLVVRGVYRWIRHPMLMGGFLFLITSGPSKNNVVFTGMYLTYMLVGAAFEERRLIRIFGEAYREYRREVGAFIPRPSVWRLARAG